MKFTKNYQGMNLNKITTTVGLNSKNYNSINLTLQTLVTSHEFSIADFETK